MAVGTSSRLRDYRWEYGKLIPRAVTPDYARQIAERFQPDSIILFGSYDYGKPLVPARRRLVPTRDHRQGHGAV